MIVRQKNVTKVTIAKRRNVRIKLSHPPKHKIADIWNYILNEHIKPNAVPNTFIWYENMGKCIIKSLGEIYIEDLTSKQIQSFLNKYKKNQKTGKIYSDKTIKERTNILKRIISYSMIEQYIKKNPFTLNVKRPKGFRRDPLDTVLEKEVLIKYLLAAKKSPVFKMLIGGLSLTGLRINEFLGLENDNIDKNNKILTVLQQAGFDYDEDEDGNYVNKRLNMLDTKTSFSVRTLPVGDLFFNLLDEWEEYMKTSSFKSGYLKGCLDKNLVFPNKFGNIRSAQGLRRQFERFIKENNLPKTTFHAFRRTFASSMQEAGVRLEVIAAFLGHEPEGYETTRKHYARSSGLLAKRDAMNMFSQYTQDVFEVLL